MTLCSVLHIFVYSRTSSVCRYHYYTATYIIGVQCLSTYVSHIGYFNYYVPLQHYIYVCAWVMNSPPQCSFPSMFLPLNVPSPQYSFPSMFLPLNVPSPQCSFPSMFLPLNVPSPQCSFPSMFLPLMFLPLNVPSPQCSFPSMFLPSMFLPVSHFMSLMKTLGLKCLILK